MCATASRSRCPATARKTKKLVALILRQLEVSGFDKEQVRRELDA
jgi:hypothetical protein